MATNVPDVQFTPTGLVVPQESAILAGVQADQDAAFGGGLNPDLTTPQGQLATSQAAVIGAKNAALLAVIAGMDPAYSSGRMQDGIGRIFGLTRNPPEPTTVSCVCTGAVSTVIPTGALATDGVNVWVCTQGGTIPVGGSITLPFACAVTGPIACPANSVNQIYQSVPGWDTVNNPSDGVVGSNVESRAAFEARRQATLQANASGPIQAMVGAVLKVSGVLDAYGYANDTAGSVTVGGVTLAAHEVYLCVSGGAAADVAAAAWAKKPPGSPWYSGANTSQTVYDTSNGYVPPYPSYTVKFQTAASLRLYMVVSIANSAAVPSDALTQIQTAVLAAFAGEDGGPRARIGQTVYASRFYAGIAALGSWASIVNIKVGSTASPTTDDQAVNIDHIPTLASVDISLTLV